MSNIIDIHNHPDWLCHNFDKFIANMNQYGIEKTCLLSGECPENEYDPTFKKLLLGNLLGSAKGPVPFANCLAYKEKAPDRFILGYAPDPRLPDAIDTLQAAIDLYDVKICGELKLRMMLDNLDAIRLYLFCGEKQLPVLVHIDYEFDNVQKYPRPNYWYGGGIDAFERAIKKCPETIFIGHAPGFWAHISGDDQFDKVQRPEGAVLAGGKLIYLLRKYPNLYCDISAGSGHVALKRDLDFTKDFLTEFQDRILYGRDCFDNQHQYLLNSFELPNEVLKKIYYENAIHILKEG